MWSRKVKKDQSIKREEEKEADHSLERKEVEEKHSIVIDQGKAIKERDREKDRRIGIGIGIREGGGRP